LRQTEERKLILSQTLLLY